MPGLPASGAGAVLVVAATPRELEGAGDARALACGIGPVEAAVRTSIELAAGRPAALLHVGIAGVRAGAGPRLLDTVLGSRSLYCDSDLAEPIVPAPDLLATVTAAVPGALVLPIGTSARLGGTAAATAVEAMEGYAVLRAAALAGVAALELRVISNEIEEPDRSRWAFDDAFSRLAEVTAAAVAALSRS